MKRSPLKRKTRLRSGSTPMRAKKKDPAKRRFAKFRNEALQDWIREQPCVIPGCGWNVQCAHVRSRGAGGIDLFNCVPLCASHHSAQHSLGIKTFQELHGLNLDEIARHYSRRFLILYPEYGLSEQAPQ